MPKDGAASSITRTKDPANGAVSGLKRSAARLTAGAICFSVSSHFPPIENSKLRNPVTLPPGRAMLETKPRPSGVDNVHEQDWDGVRFLHQRGYRRRCHADNEVGFKIYEFPCECAHLIGPAWAPTKFDAEVAAFGPTQLLEPLLQSCNASLRLRISRCEPAQHCNP